MASERVTFIKNILLGEDAVIATNPQERIVRCLIGWIFIGPVLFIGFELSPTAWALSLCAAIVLIKPRIIRNLAYPTAIRWWFVFSIFSLLSSIWSIAPDRSIQAGFVCLVFGAVAVIFLKCVDDLDNRHLARCWIAVRFGCWIGIFALVASELIFLISAGGGRFDVEHVRTLHKITLYGTIFAVTLLHNSETKTAIWVAAIFALPTLLLGKTTGINLAIILVAIVYIFPQALRVVSNTVVCGTVALALLAPFIVHAVYNLLDRSNILQVEQFLSYSARMELWKILSPQVLESLFFGHGADTLRVTATMVEVPKYYDLKDIPSAHNFAFDVWYDLGLFGVSLLCFFILSIQSFFRKMPKYSLFFFSTSLVVVLIEFSVDHRIWLSWAQGFTAFIVLCGALIMRTRAPLIEVQHIK